MKTTEKEVKKTDMESFEWDSNDSVEFFGQKEEVNAPVLTTEEKEALKKEVETLSVDEKVPKESKKKVEKVEKTNTEDVEETEEEVEEEVEFFKENKETEAKIDTSTEINDDIFKVLASDFKERGILNFEGEIEDDLDEEGFTKLYENEIESRIQETFEGFFEELDEDGKAFLKFKKDGGNTSDFFNVLKTTSSIPNGDIEDETHQREIAEYYFKNVEKVDDEDIADKIEWLEDNNKLEKYAKKYHKILDETEKKEKAAILKRQEEQVEQSQKETIAFQKELKQKLSEYESVKNLPLLKTEKTELLNFITKPTVKVGKNNYITEFQSSLQKISSDYEGLIALAKLMKSNFDFTTIKIKEETKQTRQLKDKIKRSKTNIKPNSSGSSMGKQLSDFF